MFFNKIYTHIIPSNLKIIKEALDLKVDETNNQSDWLKQKT